MDHTNGQRIPADLIEVAERLRDERPTASSLQLDEVKLRAKGQAMRQTGFVSRQKGRLMKSRLALTAILALGIVFSGAGATLAVSGISGDGSAGSFQYLDPGGGGGGGDGGGAGGVLGGDDFDGDAGAGDAQEGVQLAVQGDDGDTLPLTGFLAIPLLIGGVALLTTGVVLRRKSSDRTSAD